MSLALATAVHSWPWWTNGYGWPWALLWLGFAVLFWGGLIAILVWAVQSAATPHRCPDGAMEVLSRWARRRRPSALLDPIPAGDPATQDGLWLLS
jgi:hypothetical protein